LWGVLWATAALPVVWKFNMLSKVCCRTAATVAYTQGQLRESSSNSAQETVESDLPAEAAMASEQPPIRDTAVKHWRPG
jgi:hypothetical protein